MVDVRVIYERLGFRPRTLSRFYANDLVQFYQKVTASADEKEEPFIRKSITVLMEYMESERIRTWEACGFAFWKKLFAFSYLDLSYEQSLEQTKLFFKTIGFLIKDLEVLYLEKGLYSKVNLFMNEIEASVLDAVNFLDIFQQKIDHPFGSGVAEVEREAILEATHHLPLVEGVFQVTHLTSNGVTLQSLHTKKEFSLSLSSKEGILIDMTMIGVIKQESEEWEILVLDRVFPPVALDYLRKAIGVTI